MTSLRVMALGLRGFPDVQGGIETHCENLFRRAIQRGVRVVVIARARYTPQLDGNEWQGVRFVRIWSPASRNLETIVHTLLGIVYAGFARPDVLHIHGVGPAIFTPLARLFGLKVVVTHHGADYDREKWGAIAKFILRTGEAAGARYANKMITVSFGMRDRIKGLYGVEAVHIPNGVNIPEVSCASQTLDQFGLEKEKYVLTVGRLVPEKRQLDLIEAFSRAGLNGWKLVIVGGADHPDEYVENVKCAAARSPDVCLTGIQRGEALCQLYSHAGIFVLPSSHEGLPIALLEALSFGNMSVASDIAPNVEIGLGADHYFPLGDVNALADKLRVFALRREGTWDRNAVVSFVATRFNWEMIADQTLDVYHSI